jgi:hypothetical protein
MSDIFVKFSYGCKNIDFGIIAIKGWFLINGVNILWFNAFVVLFPINCRDYYQPWLTPGPFEPWQKLNFLNYPFACNTW